MNKNQNPVELDEDIYSENSISPEEIAARKEQMLAFYKEQIEFMTTQVEFEKLTAEIEEQRLRRLVAMVRQAQIQSPPEEQEDSEQPSPEKKRSLKKS